MIDTAKKNVGEKAGWGALAGLRVLDFTQSLSGPFCTQILADLGATVIKVETIKEGDGTRRTGPFHPSDTERAHSGYFHSVNRNKKSIAVDLKSADGRTIVLGLAKNVDVVVENFRVGTMDRLGLSYEALSADNEKLIYAAIRGFGDPRSGASPYANWPAFDVVAQAMGGIAGVTGPAPGQPTKIGPGVGDIVPGIFLAVGILAAVVNRQRTGKGQFVDVAMVDAVLALTERIVYQRSFGQVVAEPPGNHQPYMAPFGLFPAKDGHVAIAAADQPFFDGLCRAIEAPEFANDARFSTIEARRSHRDELIEELSRRTVVFTKAELLQKLGGVIPFGPVYTMADIAADPHFAARQMLAEVDLEGVSEPLSIAGVPIKMSATPGGVYKAGPTLGEDSTDILREMGYADADIASFRARGIVK